MARATRYINIGFFTNTDLAQLDPFARLAFAGLWLIVDREGRIEDNPLRIKAAILPYDDCNMDKLLNQLVDRNFITRYQVDETKVIQVSNWHKHQRVHKDEKKSTLPSHGGSTEDPGKFPTTTSTSTSTSTSTCTPPDGGHEVGSYINKVTEADDVKLAWAETAVKAWGKATEINPSLQSKSKLKPENVDALWEYFNSYPAYKEDAIKALSYVAAAKWPDDANFIPACMHFWKPDQIKKYSALMDRKLKNAPQNADPNDPEVIALETQRLGILRLAEQMNSQRGA